MFFYLMFSTGMWCLKVIFFDSIVLVFIAQFPLISKGEDCTKIICSNLVDYVCGKADKNGIVRIEKFQNMCHLNKVRCRLREMMEIYQVPDELCNITKTNFTSGRRQVNDFTITGTHQACNHTCPTYCVDTYEPACARIWSSPPKNRAMINHCHVDLLSCAAGLNVTVQPLAACYKDPSRFMFLIQLAGLKTLKLLDPQLDYKMLTNKMRRMNQAPSKHRRADLLRKLLKFTNIDRGDIIPVITI